MPKTVEQEKLEGSPGHRPVNKNAPDPDRTIPDPPKFLSRVGKRVYHDLVRLVGNEGMQVMAKSDTLALSLICDAYAEYRAARDILENGRYYKVGEMVKRHPAVGDMQDAWKRVMQGLGKFGMTPYDRRNVNALEKEKEESREDKIKRRRAEAAEKAKQAAQNGEHIKKVSNV